RGRRCSCGAPDGSQAGAFRHDRHASDVDLTGREIDVARRRSIGVLALLACLAVVLALAEARGHQAARKTISSEAKPSATARTTDWPRPRVVVSNGKTDVFRPTPRSRSYHTVVRQPTGSRPEPAAPDTKPVEESPSAAPAP